MTSGKRASNVVLLIGMNVTFEFFDQISFFYAIKPKSPCFFNGLFLAGELDSLIWR